MSKSSVHDEKEYVYVGTRVEDLQRPYTESYKEVCENCNKAIWVSEATRRQCETAAQRVCINCVIEQNGLK